MGNTDLMFIAPEPGEQFRRAFEAVGYGHELILKADYARRIGFRGACCDDEQEYRRRIIESLRDKGRPALAFGVIGPPECCVVTGYDEGGDVLLGWSFFQDMPDMNAGAEFEPCGYFRKRDWYRDTVGLITIGERQSRPLLAETYRQALRWGVELTRTPRLREYHAGLAAYTAWAEALLRDDEFAAGEMAKLRDHYMVHFDAMGTVAEGRWYGAEFLKDVARELPAMVQELEAAGACYVREHDLMWDVWNLAGGNGVSDEHARKLAEPAVRREIAAIILQARDRDAEAAEHIERALAS